MSPIECCIIGSSLVALAIWLNGCIKRSIGSCAAGLVIAVVSCETYFIAFSLTHVPYLGASLFCPLLLTIILIPAMRRTRAGLILIGITALLGASAFAYEYRLMTAGNALLVIEPYRSGRLWRFDEPQYHLKGEPFVSGASEMIDKMAGNIPDADGGIRLIFCQQQFTGSQYRLDWLRSQDAGNWYRCQQYGMDCWLCPALFKFFPRPPLHIYVRAEAK